MLVKSLALVAVLASVASAAPAGHHHHGHHHHGHHHHGQSTDDSSAAPSANVFAEADSSNSTDTSSYNGQGSVSVTGGRATFYTVEADTGACGENHSGEEDVVALNTEVYHQSMKDNFRSNYCHKTVSIKNTANGKTAQAIIVDECRKGCNGKALDLSKKLFRELNDGDMDAGVFPIDWSIE